MWKPTQALMDTITHYSQFPATGVSLRQMVQFGRNPSAGTLFKASQFLMKCRPFRELPIGICSHLRKLLAFRNPSSLEKYVKKTGLANPDIEPAAYRSPPWLTATNATGSGRKAQRRYYATVDDGVRWPPEIVDYNKRFTKTLQNIKHRHDPVVTTMAMGINEYKRKRQRMQIDNSIQAFLDRFYMSRIGIRMLIGQHVALNSAPEQEDYVGIICTKTNVCELAQEAIENARFVCEDYYGLFDAPKVQLVCKPDLHFMYVPGHLSHMLFETLKNSLRAVVETHGSDAEEFPPVKLIVTEGKEDITIKISDEGGGVPRSAIPLVWTYMYTTVESTPPIDPDFNKSDFKAPMAGFGYGLPISRLYARYFGGDLKLISMEGYGTDVYLHLNRLSSSSEPLQ
ncbi:mitochondrial branched-chain alpha-ketoacid dehydrogenase kinase-domain-containing protein [Tuber brumale]|nr:mitochondrial branched-chain alpha-ketoacid dehydrogenase kinase-domain-containing protein [Tuber brumale]